MRDHDDTEYLKWLGNSIRSRRIFLGYNQTEFANMIGKDQPSINRLENGKINPGILYLRQVAKGLEIDLRDLI